MPKIPKVNENNEIIGETTIKEAKENGWARRIIRIYILDPTHEYILLQKRGPNMNSYANTWDQAVGGHVDFGESAREAAEREMLEEIGITADLDEIITWFTNEPEKMFEGVFKAVVALDTDLTVDPHEVEEMKWVTISDYEHDIAVNPKNYTPGSIVAWNAFRDTLLTI